MASLDLLHALAQGPLKLATALLRPAALAGLPPALAELAGDPTARLDALLAPLVAPPATHERKGAQRHSSAAPLDIAARFLANEQPAEDVPANAFMRPPIVGWAPGQRTEFAPASFALAGQQEQRRPETLTVTANGLVSSAEQGEPTAGQLHPAHVPSDGGALPLWPAPARQEVRPSTAQSARSAAAPPVVGPASSDSPTLDGSQLGELRLVRGPDRLHSLLNASVRPSASAPAPADGGSVAGAPPLPATGQRAATAALAATALPLPAPFARGAAQNVMPDLVTPAPDPAADPVPTLAPDSAAAPPYDVERLLDELAERLEIEYLRTYGTSG